jgi:Uma2 family endonuclease
MAASTPHTAPAVLTYEQYLAEGEVHQRYDIVDGVRIYMPAPTWRHQRVQVNVTGILREYEQRHASGYVIPAPFDVLIRSAPTLQTRQPDVLFITRQRLEQAGGIPEAGPLEVAPELVVEIVSGSETGHSIADKLADYTSIGVKECWLVRPEARIVDVVRLSPDGPVTGATFDETDTLQSITFPDLVVSVAEFFRS